MDLERLHDVPVDLAVEIGRTQMTIREALALTPGSIVALNRLAGEPVDLLVNGRPLARGEVVVIDEEFGLRVTEIVSAPPAEEEPFALEAPPDQAGTPPEAAPSLQEVALEPIGAAPPVEAPVVPLDTELGPGGAQTGS